MYTSLINKKYAIYLATSVAPLIFEAEVGKPNSPTIFETKSFTDLV